MITREQLQQFCSEDETRHQLRAPYIRFGDTYATDGRIAIRVFGAVPEVETHDDYPNAAAVINPIPTTGLWFRPTLADGVGEDFPCPDCNGDTSPCTACKGDGEVEWKFATYTRMDMCPLCRGQGYGCNTCDDTGTVHDETPIHMGLNWYKAFYIRRIMALPGAELCGGEAMEPARIRFDGGDGGVMPLDVNVWNDQCKARGEIDKMVVTEGGPL